MLKTNIILLLLFVLVVAIVGCEVSYESKDTGKREYLINIKSLSERMLKK